MIYKRRNILDRGNSKSKGPEMGTNLACLKNFTKTSVGRPVVGAEGRWWRRYWRV